ncbi:hypothetical protein GCM10011512_05930 [Tersicoccus solisilvae]|uniref:DUF3618 domain-containing protein n=1 Tax=Tersicoccus solisilvae TaxID=1882339 RepID=A0ABQ1NP49_9MICC|nr:DUF3618 domain-containing protein [Tersicoccus solisilvae]GGC81994.1 hypothetical protein GCM10011512_05930 [Tersicoccus solisilvae]
MSSNPDEIRADIERTRAELGQDVDALAEKVSPTKAVSRQTDKVRDRLTDVRESIMGSPDHGTGHSGGGVQDVKDRAGDLAHEAGDRASELANGAADAVRSTPAQVRRGTRGNPLAAGLIALGAGWLVGSLIPASRAEQDAAASVKEQAGPVLDQAKSVAQEMGENLKPQVQEAAQSVKDTATEGVQNVKDEGQGHAEDLKGQSTEAAQHVKDTAQSN